VAQDQRVEFLFAAQVSGQEQLQKLISSVDSLRKETEQLKSANAGLASSTDAVIRNGVRYNNAIDAQSKALRQARQGTQQLGMQINDFATSVSTGASPIQAFNQQIGQVGIAMSLMGGKLGTVGAFLAGPWGAAILVATMVLSPFIESLFNAGAAAKGLEESEKKVRDSSINLMFAKAELDAALGRNTDSYEKASNAAINAALSDLKAAETAVTASNIRMKAAKNEAKALGVLKVAGGATGNAASMVLGLFGYGDTKKADKERLDAISKRDDADAKYTREIAAQKKRLLKPTVPSGARAGARAAASIPAPKMEKVKVKPDFSMLGFYEEFFAEEFKQNDKSLAKVAEDQINSLLSTIPEMGKMSDEMDKIISRNEELNNSFDAIGQSVSNSFKGMITGAMSFRTAMKGIIGAVIDELFRLYVVQQVVGVVKGAFGGLFGVPVLPGKAIGGSVGKNRPYMVGEQGPELFIPGGSGTIIPNRNLSSNGGGSSFNISVDARGSNDPAAVRAQVQQGIIEAAPAIIAAAEARTISSMRRPRLGGVMQ
jgi:hypothetical protein